MTQYLKLATDNGIATVTIDRQPALNALNADVLAELTAAFKTLAEAGSAKVILLKGAGGKAFVAGADIAAMQKMTAAEADKFIKLGQGCMSLIANSPMPVIAVVNGYALGGGFELALSCDWILASTKAVFGLPEVTLGLYPGFGGTQRLPRLIGYARAMELICTGRRLKADEALAWGIANQVVTKEELTATATKMAQQICANSHYAIRQAKQAIRDGMNVTLDAGMDVERKGFMGLFGHPDRVEGLTAFLEKRKASFQ